jgi:hypothetical protein
MSYATGNPPTKKALKELVASGVQVHTFNPSGLFPVTQNGEDIIEMPQNPKPHRYYAKVDVRNGIITKVY